MSEIKNKRFKRKKVSETQEYENYWKITLEYSNIHSEKFINTLKIIIDFIDEKEDFIKGNGYSKLLYKQLTERIEHIYPKADSASTRKSINQFIKLGFVKPFFNGYHNKAKQFLRADNEKKRELTFSEIFYKSATFNSAVTNDNTNIKPINFLLKTLMYHPEKKLNIEDIVALMVTDISTISKGYLTFEEIEIKKIMIEQSKFIERKYNQINYLKNLLKYIPGVTVSKDYEIAYTEDASEVLRDSISTQRDMTMYRIMKENLKEECISKYGKLVCYFTKKEFKGLVVSHIWRSEDALKSMDVDAAYDYENAILLEPNTDSYFDKYNLTFSMDGNPTYDSTVSKDFINDHIGNKLDLEVLTDKRKGFLIKHNEKYRLNNF